jgi:hypothetical protein
MEALSAYLISFTTWSTNKTIAAVVLVVVIVAGLFFWRRSRAA